MSTAWTKTQTTEAIADLKELLKPGDDVYTYIDTVSRSGMSRTIKCYIVVQKDQKPYIRDISHLVAKATERRINKDRAVIVGGCGMDMAFALVYELGYALYPDGFGQLSSKDYGAQAPMTHRPKTKKEAANMIEAGVVFERGRNGDTGGWDNDGGYALNKRDL